jgi:RND family efflux transporter MFP subunit
VQVTCKLPRQNEAASQGIAQVAGSEVGRITMTDDKTKLLRSLTIDRSVSEAGRSADSRRWLPMAADVAACVVVAFAAFAVSEFRMLDRPKEASQPAAQPQSPQPQQRQAAASGGESGNLAASGYVVARRKATVAAEITGKVVEVFIDEGMTVTDGQIVARLDSVLAEKDHELAQSRVEAADAAIAAITADLQDSTRILSRVQTLSQKNFATEAELTKAQARVGVLSAQLRQVQSQFETARIDAKRSASVLDKHQIRAPFAGVVVDRSAQPGEMISPMSVGGFTRTGICTIVDMDSIEIEVDVNEAFIGRVAAGGAVNAVLDAYPDWTIPASVIAIVPTANREKATVRVRIRFVQRDPRILPDMAVKVTFLRDAKAGSAAAAETTAAN